MKCESCPFAEDGGCTKPYCPYDKDEAIEDPHKFELDVIFGR